MRTPKDADTAAVCAELTCRPLLDSIVPPFEGLGSICDRLYQKYDGCRPDHAWQRMHEQKLIYKGSCTLRAKGGVLLVIMMCLLSSWRLLKQAGQLHPGFSGEDTQSLYDKRFDDLRKMLPKHGVVGYFGDSQTDQPGVAHYYLTQYALAPLVVDNSIDHHFVVGNFADPNSTVPMNHDLVLVRDFGNGVILLENRMR
jgi:hypothetical protein